MVITRWGKFNFKRNKFSYLRQKKLILFWRQGVFFRKTGIMSNPCPASDLFYVYIGLGNPQWPNPMYTVFYLYSEESLRM